MGTAPTGTHIQRKAAFRFAAGVLAAIEDDVKPDALAFVDRWHAGGFAEKG